MVTNRNYGVGTGYTSSGIIGRKTTFAKDEQVFACHVWDNLIGSESFRIQWQREVNGVWETEVLNQWTNEGYSSAYQYSWIRNYSPGKWRASFYCGASGPLNSYFTIEEGETEEPDWQHYNFTSIPSIAAVYEGTRYLRTTPSWYSASYNSHTFTCKKAGYKDVSVQVGVKPGGERINVSFVLEQLETAGHVRGKVIDSILKAPLSFVIVKFSNYQTITNAEGNYDLEVPIGSSGPITFSLGNLWETYSEIITCGPGINVDLNVELVKIVEEPEEPEEKWYEDLIKAAVFLASGNHILINLGLETLLKLPDGESLFERVAMYGFDKLTDEAPEYEVLRGAPKSSITIAAVLGILSLILGIGTVVGWLRKEAPEPSGMAVWAMIEAGQWEAANTANQQYLNFINTMNSWIPVVISWFNPFLAAFLNANKESQLAQAAAFQILIDAELAIKTGLLTIRPTPADSKVSVSGQIPTTGVFSNEIPIGPYTWTVSLFGYISKSGTIELTEAGEDFSVEILKVEEEKETELTISVQPSDANIQVSGHPEINSPGTYILDPGTYTIIFSKEGYQTKERTIYLEAGDKKTISEILPGITGSLTIECDPPQAIITIAGHPEITKVGTYTLDEGAYTIWFHLEGYKDGYKYVNVRTDIPSTASMILIKEEEPEPERAEILITSQPSGARIIIDGESTYQTTTYTAFLDQGQHKIRVELNSYEPQERDLNVEWGEISPEHFILIKTPPTKGTLRIESEPPGAQVFIDGESKFSSTPYTITLEAGTYKIRLTREGYLPSEEDVEIIPGQEMEHKIILEKEPITDARITIDSVPSEADIYIDGVYQYAKTPFTKLLKPTLYTIRVQKEGYYPETSYLEFEEGEETTITFSLTEIPAPEIPIDPYIPETPYYPGYEPPQPYVPTIYSFPPAQVPAYNYDLLYPELMAVPGIEPVTPPTDRELLINIETTDLMPTKGRIYSIAFLDLSDPNAEIQIMVSNNEQELIDQFLTMFEAGNYSKLLGYNVTFDHRYIFAKMMKYRRPSKAWKNIQMRDVMQIMKQVQEAFVFGFNKPGTLDEWGKMILGVGKYGTQELMLKKYLQGDFDYVKAFNNRQIELTRDLYSLTRFVSSEAFKTAIPSIPVTTNSGIEPGSVQNPGQEKTKVCPVCLAYNFPSSRVCEVCGANI